MALMDHNAENAMREAGIPYSDAHDHDYVPTITGLCSRPNCRRPQVEHLARIAQPPFMERRMVTGIYTGPEQAPGRGGLSAKWCDWALSLRPIDAEFRS